jgi:hypothetical protein
MNILITAIITFLFIQLPALAQDQELDKFISLDGKVTIKRESDLWLKVSVPFQVISNPDLDALEGKKPRSREELFNPKYLDSLELNLFICFRNEFARKFFRTEKTDPENFQYYSASLKCIILEVGSNYVAHFLFPSAIAERDDFGGSYPEMVGFAIDFSRKGKQFDVSGSIHFEKYKSVEILDKFKAQAQSKSLENEGILIPAYKLDQSYLRDLGPVYLD